MKFIDVFLKFILIRIMPGLLSPNNGNVKVK